MTDEEAAKSVCEIIKAKGANGKTIMIGALMKFFDEKHGSRAELAKGMDYAKAKGWITTSDVQAWLIS
jgi:predicted transcriptional regulator